MKEKTSRRSLERKIIQLVCVSLLSGGIQQSIRAADPGDDWTPFPTQPPQLAQKSATVVTSGATAVATTTAAASDDPENDTMPGASASPTPMSSDETPDAGDEAPAPKPAPAYVLPGNGAPHVDVEPALPQGPDADVAADAVPLPANPPLQQQFSEWDLAQVESPLFLNAAIDEFNERPVLITNNWSVKPHLSLGTYYDGNIFLRSHGAEGDMILRAAPGLTMRLGNTDSMFYLMADYTAGFDYYISHPSLSTVDQSGRAQMQWSMPKTIIGLTLDASTATGQDVDVSDRVRQEFYFAGLTSHYDFGEKTSWDVSADYARTDFNGLISSAQWEGDVFFNYQYSPKTQLGIGGGGGLMTVVGADSQVFEDADVRATYRATGKLTLIAAAGAEFRQFGGGQGGTETPVFSLESSWVPRYGTEVSLTARRSIYASAILDDQNYTATSLDFNVKQRITDSVDVSMGAGFVNADYTATATDVTASREDNYFYIRPAVEWKALTWLTVGIFYQYSQDLSSGGGDEADGFTRDSGGVDVAILF